MLTNFFGKSKPISSITVVALFFVLFLLAFFGDKIDFKLAVFPLFLLMFAIANFIIAKNELTFGNSFAFLFFVLLISFFPSLVKINTTFYANLTVLLFLRKLYSLRSSANIFRKLFDAGFWLGISFLIEPFTFVFVLLLYASIYLQQTFTIHTLLIPVVGFLAPLFLFFTYCFWYDKTADFINLFIWFTNYDYTLYTDKSYFFPFIFLGVFISASAIIKTPRALAVKNTFRKKWQLILLHFAVALIIALLVKDKNGSELLYLLLPSAVILANGLELIKKKWISDVVLTIFFISSVVMCLI